tara:strand:+ start:649 stop:1101 length:453 start_codon:yes stop_codon:yes gene_type:complete
MDKKTSDEISKELGIFDETPLDVEIVKEAPKPIKKPRVKINLTDKKEDLEKDYQYTRAQLYDLVEKMQEAVDGALETAQDSSHPRAFEVALNGMKATSEVVEKLGDLQKKMRELEQESPSPGISQNNTQNNIFVSTSTAELLKSLKDGTK